MNTEKTDREQNLLQTVQLIDRLKSTHPNGFICIHTGEDEKVKSYFACDETGNVSTDQRGPRLIMNNFRPLTMLLRGQNKCLKEELNQTQAERNHFLSEFKNLRAEKVKNENTLIFMAFVLLFFAVFFAGHYHKRGYETQNLEAQVKHLKAIKIYKPETYEQ